MRIKPFQALRPSPDKAEQVASVPYDTVDTAEARELAGDNPWSFLRVVRPEIDLPDGTDLHAESVYEKAAENLARFEAENVLVREDGECVYLYRQRMGQHEQRGLVVCCHIDDYANNIILKHEKTRQDKEDDRTTMVRRQNANTGPVFLTYRDVESIDVAMETVEAGEPLYDLTASDGIAHTLWRIPDSGPLVAAFASVPKAYVADGHHRSAAAARAGAEKREANPNHTGEEEYNWFLAVLFPASQLQILPYNRCVHDLNGKSEAEFLDAVRECFAVTEGVDPCPASPRHAGMYVGGRWYGLSWEVPEGTDPVSALDASFLQDQLLKPILGIEDPRTATRIDFIGGIRGPEGLVRLVDKGRGSVALSLYPVTVDQMMAVADAGLIMPPKSTWFEPKLRSGLLVHTL